MCGAVLRGPVCRVEGADDYFCAGHPFCQVCAEPHLSMDRCPTLSGGVRLDGDARRLADDVAATLAGVGVHLPRDVPLELVTSLPEGELGLTVSSSLADGRPAEVPSLIQVRVGLDETLFCTVVAHELTHAWMHVTGIEPVDVETAEGICELVALIWLTQSGAPRAEHGIRRLLHNSHPTYRNGARAALRAARTTSVPHVLDHVRATGRLPEVSPR